MKDPAGSCPDAKRALLFLALSLLVLLPGCTLISSSSDYFRALFGQTEPDYGALEEDRAKQASRPAPSDRPTADLPPYWTSLRGPQGDGSYDEQPIRTDWPKDGLPCLWRQPSGGGYGSFVVARGLAFTLEQRRDREAIVAYDLESGREIWQHAYEALFESAMGDGPRSTPAWSQNRLITLGATGELRCVQASDGELIWRRNVFEDARADNLEYGSSASPLIAGDLVIALAGAPGAGQRAVRAYRFEDGAPVWANIAEPSAYATPVLVRIGGEDQVVVHTATRLVSLALRNGELLWEHPWEVFTGLSCSQPVEVAEGRILLSGGYGVGSELLEITSSATGFQVESLWRSRQLKCKFNSPVVHEGQIYGLDEGVLTCLDLETGRRRWKAGRYGYGQVLLSDGHLIVLTEEGELSLVRATPTAFEERARFLAIEGMTWNLPALAHGRLLVRNAAQMACFRIGGPIPE